jgi:membrane protein DedA with SNARE-associated domain
MPPLLLASHGHVAPLVAAVAHHHHHYASVDLVGLGIAAAASWAGVPGPGEGVLIAAGVLAAKHHLSIGTVVLVAFAGAVVGGAAGWALGMKAGRAVLARPGPLLKLRLHALARGEQVFERATVLAILLTPSWVAGIHRVRAGVYQPVNALSAAVWAAGIGFGAYFAGPPVVDVVGDAGSVMLYALIALVVVVLGAELLRRRRVARTP